jgi:tRNA 2-selenouridine synthase
VAARAEYLVAAYADVIADPERLAGLLQPLRQFRGHAAVEGWLALLARGAHRDLAVALIEEHYDPAYAKSRAVHRPEVLAELWAETLDAAGREALAARVEAVLSGM